MTGETTPEGPASVEVATKPSPEPSGEGAALEASPEEQAPKAEQPEEPAPEPAVPEAPAAPADTQPGPPSEGDGLGRGAGCGSGAGVLVRNLVSPSSPQMSPVPRCCWPWRT